MTLANWADEVLREEVVKEVMRAWGKDVSDN